MIVTTIVCKDRKDITFKIENKSIKFDKKNQDIIELDRQSNNNNSEI